MKAGAVAHSTYSALVQSDVDMTGHVAYALYKRDKLKFCESFAASRQRAPSADELQVFIDSANLSTRISAYRTEAEAALQDFAQEVLEVQLDEQEAAFNARLAGELRPPVRSRARSGRTWLRIYWPSQSVRWWS